MAGTLVVESGPGGKPDGAEGARGSALLTRGLLGLIAFGYAIESLGADGNIVNPARDWARHYPNVPKSLLGLAGLTSFFLTPLLAWASDRAALRGGRRGTAILCLSLALGAFWLLFDPESSQVSTVAGLGAFFILGSVLRAILGGLAVDTGHRYGATSAVSGARELGIRAAMLAAAIVASRGSFPLALSAARVLAVGFGLLAIVCGLVPEWPSARTEYPSGERTSRRRGFWTSLLFLAWLGALEHLAAAVAHLRVSGLVAGSFVVAPAWLGPLLSSVLAIGYMRLGHRLPASRLPLFALASGGGTAVLAVASFVLPPAVSSAGLQVLGAFAWLPVVDFGMRFVAPRASALGFWCLLTLPRLLTSALAVPILISWARTPSAVNVLTIACVASMIVGLAAWRLSRGTLRGGDRSCASPPAV